MCMIHCSVRYYTNVVCYICLPAPVLIAMPDSLHVTKPNTRYRIAGKFDKDITTQDIPKNH